MQTLGSQLNSGHKRLQDLQLISGFVLTSHCFLMIFCGTSLFYIIGWIEQLLVCDLLHCLHIFESHNTDINRLCPAFTLNNFKVIRFNCHDTHTFIQKRKVLLPSGNFCLIFCKYWTAQRSLQFSSFVYNANNGSKLSSPLPIFNNCIHCGVFFFC